MSKQRLTKVEESNSPDHILDDEGMENEEGISKCILSVLCREEKIVDSR